MRGSAPFGRFTPIQRGSSVLPRSSSDSLADQDVVWFSPQDRDTANKDAGGQTEFNITALAQKSGLPHGALRVYEVRRLLKPQRAGRRRVFSRPDRDRLALIV